MRVRSLVGLGVAFILTVVVGTALAKWMAKRSDGGQNAEFQFTAIPDIPTDPRAELDPRDLIEFVDVRRVDYVVPRGQRQEVDLALFNTFANNPHERSYRVMVTESAFPAVLAAYQEKLVSKAEQAMLPAASLRECLRAIKSDKPPVLPVGAYLVKYGRDDVWVIVGKWEFWMGPAIHGGTRIGHLSHVRVWAIRAQDREVLAYLTCM